MTDRHFDLTTTEIIILPKQRQVNGRWVANQRDFPGWGHMLENGAATLWEHWTKDDDTFSHNHPMFGSVSQWFFNWLGGIQADPETVGFDRFSIRPQLTAELDWVKCRYESIRGPIVCDWRRRGLSVDIVIEVPVNSTATVYLPAANPDSISESGRPAAEADGVDFLRIRRGNHRVPRRIGSILVFCRLVQLIPFQYSAPQDGLKPRYF